MSSPTTAARIRSIDVLRGLTILVMVFVNELAGVSGMPQWAKHMPGSADGMSFVDVVFPAFLFIVGMSIPFAIKNRLSKGDTMGKVVWHIVFRTLGLLVLGLFMVNAEGGYNEEKMLIPIPAWSLLFYLFVILIWKVYYSENKVYVYTMKGIGVAGLIALYFLYKGGENGDEGMKIHWWGILGLIGWAYFFAAIIYLLTKDKLIWMFTAIAACIVFYVLGKTPGLEGSFFSAHSGHAIHTSLVLCGLTLSTIFFGKRYGKWSFRAKYERALAYGLALAVAAFILHYFYPISKIGATPPWALYCSAICTVLYMIIYLIVDIKQQYKWTGFLQPAASNPLLTYIIPFIIGSAIWLSGVEVIPAAWKVGAAGVVWSIAFSFLVLGISYLLTKWKLRLQL
ncbi:uncharacterized protein DUF5009 [Chitinophaga skermanii]|uniref:Uncharacterized protein DUF5009 n=1 Tax=Chitinophaga skermanii TaxID=331697 RepID=A0A327R5F8_9BACT|nr:DUF5009 domain-containing protein [Chitinophaga skermanii]RAJ10934.1 uncharacterized protein DUF5009 [Chitinophaga skermanii]